MEKGSRAATGNGDASEHAGKTTRTAGLAPSSAASEQRPDAAAASPEAPAAIWDDITAGTGREVPFRGEMEQAFGQDFGGVTSRVGERAAMGSLGARAAAVGEQVVFADAEPDRKVVAHELAHVVQNRGAGATAAMSLKADVGAVDSAAEREADAVAERVACGLPAGPITATPGGIVQRLAPDAHEQATVGGLSATFSPEEVAATYAANWERDFSQGSAYVANIAILWRELKLHAATSGGKAGPKAAAFQAAVKKFIDMPAVNLIGEDARDKSLGGYQTWEHIDQPEDGPKAAAAARWAKDKSGLDGHLLDVRAYIKDELVAAVEIYRQDHTLPGLGTIDNWGKTRRPDGYVAPQVNVTPTGVTTNIADDTRMLSRDPIREGTRQLAIEEGGAPAKDPHFDPKLWAMVGHHLGKSMHAFEDFWAHSNWMTLARQLQKAPGTAAKNSDLHTGTFPVASQIHALGHKLLAVSTAFQADFPLLLDAYGLTAESTKFARGPKSPWWKEKTPSEKVFGPLDTNSSTPGGEGSDVLAEANLMENMVKKKEATMSDFLCNREWLAALESKARLLIDEGDRKSDAGSHGKMAADQPEHGKEFGAALALAKRADALVFAPLRAIMDERDAARAQSAIRTQLALIDVMMQAPSTSHPLWQVVLETTGPGDYVLPGGDTRLG